MGRSGETNPSRSFWKLIFSAVALLCTLPLVAQKPKGPSPPKYDVHSETKMKGTVLGSSLALISSVAATVINASNPRL